MIDRQLAGTEFPEFTISVERGQIRLFAKAIGETDPRYLDVGAAPPSPCWLPQRAPNVRPVRSGVARW